MKLFRSLGAAALLVLTTLPASAQAPLVPEKQAHLDLAIAGASLGFAARTSERTSFGVEIGGGGNWVNYMLLGGRHFAEDGGPSYATKDGATSKSLFELAHATVFMRTHFNETQHLDLGVKASGFLHFDSSDDDPGGGYFLGMNAKYNWAKWKRIGLASEMDIGRYAEPGLGGCMLGCGEVHEFGINVAPILVRFTFP